MPPTTKRKKKPDPNRRYDQIAARPEHGVPALLHTAREKLAAEFGVPVGPSDALKIILTRFNEGKASP